MCPIPLAEVGVGELSLVTGEEWREGCPRATELHCARCWHLHVRPHDLTTHMYVPNWMHVYVQHTHVLAYCPSLSELSAFKTVILICQSRVLFDCHMVASRRTAHHCSWSPQAAECPTHSLVGVWSVGMACTCGIVCFYAHKQVADSCFVSP